jgi:hypothetical protein
VAGLGKAARTKLKEAQDSETEVFVREFRQVSSHSKGDTR